MRQALRGVREQLGEDAVILSSRRTGDGVEVTAAIDFDASTLEAGGFSDMPAAAAAPIIDAQVLPTTAKSRTAATPPRTNIVSVNSVTAARGSSSETRASAASGLSQSALVLTNAFAAKSVRTEAALAAAAFQQVANDTEEELERIAQPGMTYDQIAASEQQPLPSYGRNAGTETEWISEAAREAVVEHAVAPRAPVLGPAPDPVTRTELPVFRGDSPTVRANSEPAREEPFLADGQIIVDEEHVELCDVVGQHDDPVTRAREAALTPFGRQESPPASSGSQSRAPQSDAADAMGNELKTLRRMLETQLAQLAWNYLSRRAPSHTEILRELTEIGITHDLAEHLVRQLPEDTDLTFARRFTIAGLSQYLKVTGDRWLDDGGRVAFAGATGVGKTTTLAKIAVRWVLRHGPRDIALIAGDCVRIGAQDQLKSLAQLLGVPVYTPERFADLPSLLTRLNERLVLIDTPGSSVRDPQLGSRLAVLANSASKLETALVIAASTQAGAIEESVRHFTPANPSCCVLTKLDEAASLGGVLSILIRARMPVSYMSEGQRVPEDLRPARALELVSAAVRLAKSRGAAADEDLLRRRFGKTAHGIS
jgi:flagellar biosynthesis protein FlhF